MPRCHFSSRFSVSSCLLAAALVLSSIQAFGADERGTIPTLRVGMQPRAQTYASEATIEAVRQATVAAQVQGRVLEVRVDNKEELVDEVEVGNNRRHHDSEVDSNHHRRD